MAYFYIYAFVAGCGIVSLPSIGVYYNDKHKDKLLEAAYKWSYTKKPTWWNCDAVCDNEPDTVNMLPLPIALFSLCLIWPAAIGGYAFGYSVVFAAKRLAKITKSIGKLLSLPGKMFVAYKNKQLEAQNDPILLEAHKEVEEFLKAD